MRRPRSSRRTKRSSSGSLWRMCAACPVYRMRPHHERALEWSTWSHGVRVGTVEGSSKFTYASPSYFATMGIPLMTGRSFTTRHQRRAVRADRESSLHSQVFLGTTQPLGQLVHVMPEPQYPERTYQIVGTIPDTKYNDLREQTPTHRVRSDRPVSCDGAGPGDGNHDRLQRRPRRDHRHPAHDRGEASGYGSAVLRFSAGHSRQPCGRPDDGHALRLLRGARGSAGRGGPVRRAVLLHHAAPQRDRYSYRAGCESLAGHGPRHARYRRDAAGGRSCRDRCWRFSPGAPPAPCSSA